MTKKSITLVVFALLVAIGLFSSTTFADEVANTPYVDLDGDGIDDNEADQDGNGIPDQFEGVKPDAEAGAGEVRSLLGNVFNADMTRRDTADLRTNTDKFGSLAFRTRGLPQRCHGFGTEEEFGAAGGLGISSGGCAGGVCIR